MGDVVVVVYVGRVVVIVVVVVVVIAIVVVDIEVEVDVNVDFVVDVVIVDGVIFEDDFAIVSVVDGTAACDVVSRTCQLVAVSMIRSSSLTASLADLVSDKSVTLSSNSQDSP